MVIFLVLCLNPLLFCRGFLQKGEIENATAEIEKLPSDSQMAISLRAFKYQRNENFSEAIEVLKPNNFESSDFLLQLGQCYFSLQQYSESLAIVLKATKLEPHNCECFHWLGKIYLLNEDTERARKCFEKCIFLNPQHEQSVILLSAIYRQLAEWDLNAKILQLAAQAVPSSPCKWAELQLGLHNLAQDNFDDAILAFRAVLRMDPNNFASWEGLADAYMKRGSFSSALKVYQKICDLTEDNSYPRLQVANIRTLLKFYNEAITSYEELLNDRPDFVPALKGIAEAHINNARKFLEERLVGRSKDHAVKAIDYLIKAILVRTNFICLWRLLANCFDFIAMLPETEAFLSIPGTLINEPQNEQVEIKGDKLFELASR